MLRIDRINKVFSIVAVVVVYLGSVVSAADVLNMGGTLNADGSWTGLASLVTVQVDNPGNAADSTGYGRVNYNYGIGKYEVTAAQYVEFLNAVAATDTYGLYSERMNIDSGLFNAKYGCNIKRSGSSGSYTYSVSSIYANRPVNNVSWGDAARFANWLENGQPTGEQGPGTTETGTYTLNGVTTAVDLLIITRNPNSTWAITSEDEWYKAAYYNPVTSSYFNYATSSNNFPGNDLNDVSGNNANYDTFSLKNRYYTTIIGEFQNSVSPYGTFDQSGNIWEWNEGIPWDPSDPARCVRGGSFNDPPYMNKALRGGITPAGEGPDFGFRISVVPEPTMLGLLTVGGLPLLRRERK